VLRHADNLKNASILSELLAHKEASGDTAGAEALKQISPIAWQHVNVHGRYEFTKRPQPIDLADIVRHLAQRPIVLEEDA
jgi:hypothetical protein